MKNLYLNLFRKSFLFTFLIFSYFSSFSQTILFNETFEAWGSSSYTASNTLVNCDESSWYWYESYGLARVSFYNSTYASCYGGANSSSSCMAIGAAANNSTYGGSDAYFSVDLSSYLTGYSTELTFYILDQADEDNSGIINPSSGIGWDKVACSFTADGVSYYYLDLHVLAGAMSPTTALSANTENTWVLYTVDVDVVTDYIQANYVGIDYTDINFDFFQYDNSRYCSSDGIGIDDVKITATVDVSDFTWTGAAGDDNWSTAGNWDVNSVPSTSDNCIIDMVPANILSGGDCNNLTVNGELNVIAGATINVNGDLSDVGGTGIVDGKIAVRGNVSITRGYTIAPSGELESGGNMTLSSGGYTFNNSGTIDCNATFNATGGSITQDANGNIEVSGTVTSFGTLNNDAGTVTYDGTSAQDVAAPSSGGYFNLTIENASTKTATGNIDVNGALTTEAEASCVLDMSTYDLNVAGNLTVGQEGGLDASDAACIVTFDGNSTVTHAGSVGSSSTTASGSNTNDVAIIDNSCSLSGTANSDVTISSSGNAEDELKTVTVNITHTYNSDLIVRLYSPSGAYVDLANGDGGGGNNFTNTVFDEDAATPISSGTPPFTGTYDLDNGANWTGTFSSTPNSADGTWTLYVIDCASGDFGTLDDWSMEFDEVVTVTSINATFNEIVVNGGDVTLADPVDVTTSLTLTSGDIITQTDVSPSTATNVLTIKEGGSVSGGSSSSHVVGALKRESALNATTELHFPLGNGTAYKPVYLTPEAGAATTFTAEFVNSAHSSIAYTGNGYNNTPCAAGVDHVANGCWWDIKNGGGANAFVAINWDANSGVDTPSDIVLSHWDGAEWEKVSAAGDQSTLADGTGGAGSGTASGGRIKSEYAQTSFSPFNLGSGSGNNSLPIDLLSFHTECSHDIVDVNFSVVSQINNEKFLIERSTDAVDWEVVGELPGVPGVYILRFNQTKDHITETRIVKR